MERAIQGHLGIERLSRRMAVVAARAGPLHGVVYRCTEPAYATEADLLTGAGSRRHGARWNAPSSFATAYASFSDLTALAESKANHVYYGLDPADVLPRTLVAVDIRLGKVLDLTDGKVRKALGISSERMRMDDWRSFNRKGMEALTQAIGRAAYEVGLEGLVVPACDGGKNLVMFPGNLQRASNVAIRNAERLRRI
jgi:RES domain-containing protein